MTPFEAIAQPFIERDYRTPHYDKAVEASRRYYRRKRKKKEKPNALLQNHG